MADIHLAQNETGEAIQLLQQVLAFNDENADIWLRYAHAARNWGMPEDAGYAARQALLRYESPKQKASIIQTFSDELELALSDPP